MVPLPFARISTNLRCNVEHFNAFSVIQELIDGIA
jgi:hypothetical protein